MLFHLILYLMVTVIAGDTVQSSEFSSFFTQEVFVLVRSCLHSDQISQRVTSLKNDYRWILNIFLLSRKLSNRQLSNNKIYIVHFILVRPRGAGPGLRTKSSEVLCSAQLPVCSRPSPTPHLRYKKYFWVFELLWASAVPLRPRISPSCNFVRASQIPFFCTFSVG